jgi:hypothetical protein
LIVFDADKGQTLDVREFDDASKAVEEYGRAEASFRDRPYIQVVLVAADSLDTVKYTHANLFACGESSTDQIRALAGHVLGTSSPR